MGPVCEECWRVVRRVCLADGRAGMEPFHPGDRRWVRLFFVDGFVAYFIGVLARGRSLVGSFWRGDSAPESAHPPLSGGQPGLNHGARTLRSSPPPP